MSLDHWEKWDYLRIMTPSARLVRHDDGIPVYDYPTDPATPPVSVVRLQRDGLPEKRRHIHDFPILLYLPDTASVHVAAAGDAIDPVWAADKTRGAAVFFDPAALDGGTRSPWPSWRSHPLLFPFVHGTAGGLLHLQLPDARKPFWESGIESLESELSDQRNGYRQAVLAHLTLLLIDLARMTDDVVGGLRRSNDPIVADVFAVIDRRVGLPLSLKDVADELGLTPGHLTTVVRRRTGRTVQEWITKRRMTEARALLAGTDMPIAEVARRVGISDAGYFARLFRSTHGISPREWRGHVAPETPLRTG